MFKLSFTLCGLLLATSFSSAAFSQAYSEQVVTGRKLDCTVIKPWAEGDGPGNQQYPLILWANGWGSKNTDVTAGYIPGLIEWAQSGPYIVVAANSRSPRESDPLACANWIKNQNSNSNSEYYGAVNIAKVGLAGHSQGAGVMIKATQVRDLFDYTSVLAMTPYASNWAGTENQNGPVLMIGGSIDEVAPVDTYARPAWDILKTSGQGGVFTILEGADHNTDAWGPNNPQQYNFGNFQYLSELWWEYSLKDNTAVGATIKSLLDNSPWTTEYDFNESFSLD